MLSPVTPLEIALIVPVAALVGVALGIVGNGYLERLRDRRRAKRDRDQAIADLLTATVDLITGAQAVRVVERAGGQVDRPWRFARFPGDEGPGLRTPGGRPGTRGDLGRQAVLDGGGVASDL